MVAGKLMVYSFSNLVARWGWVVNATPRLLYLREGNPAPIVQEPGWAPGPAWTSVQILVPTGFDPRTTQPVANRCTYYAIPARKSVFTYI
jgi:hypothetical protein